MDIKGVHGMEMERINDNLIKVTIDSQDLVERDINFLDLIGSQHEIEAFFRSVLDEVDVDNQFKDSDAVTFQVIPTSNGLELFISREDEDASQMMPDDPREYFDRLLKSTLGLTDEMIQKESKERSKSNLTDQMDQQKPSFQIEDEAFEENEDSYAFEEEVLHFNSLEDFISMARNISHDGLITSLYTLRGEYFMILTVEPDWDQPMSTMVQRFAQMLEFCDLASITPAVLKEHGTLIKELDALEIMSKL